MNWIKKRGDEEERKPPTMTRSLRQLSTAYAPGALFTWEGGLGACQSVAIQTRPIELSLATRDAIREQIEEYLTAWLQRGSRGTYRAGNEPSPERLVDGLILRNGEPNVTEDKLAFVSAQSIGYSPFPLAFVCRHCQLYAASRDVTTLSKDLQNFEANCPRKNEGKPCSQRPDWEQLDVVMVHWSGTVWPLAPTQLNYDTAAQKIQHFDSCSSCGGKHFKLLRNSERFSDWKFECSDCRTTRPVLMSDEFTLNILKEGVAAGTVLRGEINLEPVSYRASAAYYPQSDKLLVFRESEFLSKLQPSKISDLKNFLGSYYGYPGSPLTDSEKEDLLVKSGRGHEWSAHRDLCKIALTLPKQARETIDVSIAQTEDRWRKEVFHTVERGSDLLTQRCADRIDFIRRYDPIRMAVEHRTLELEKFQSNAKADDGKDVSVDVTRPDAFLLPEDMPSPDKTAANAKVSQMLGLLGIAEMRLIRDLQLCEFSFGYTRVASSPTIKREKAGDQDLPVRLRLFDKITSNEKPGHPIYCQQQANEAFYFRLDEGAVRDWLARNGIDLSDVPCERLGGYLIEQYEPFDRFLSEFRSDRSIARSSFPYVYTLIHTIAHQAIGVMSELSGLDLGSFGEHLFVPDLAFIVYRRGVTMDLGNLSSMWRNHCDPAHGNEVLHKMVMPETLRCGSETICMSLRGGACPDCILIPENACLTRNELLSRSVLVGRGTPLWDKDTTELVGFYDVTRERYLARKP